MATHARELSPEYTRELWREAKEHLPRWLFAVLHKRARDRAGGFASQRVHEPDAFEKLAIAEIRPATIRGVSDTELGSLWRRLNQLYANAVKRRQVTEDFVNAAVWVIDERERRGLSVGDTGLAQAVDKLRSTSKNLGLETRLLAAPRDLMVVQDFACVVGSTAEGKRDPADLDVMLRAPWDHDAGQLSVQAELVWLQLRKVLDPDGDSIINWIGNPQGAHGDNIPMYDLVLRRKETFERRFVKGQKTGVMVALMLSDVAARALAIPGGEPPSQMHCTLGYLGRLENLPADIEQRAVKTVTEAVSQFGPVVGTIGGVGRFNASKTSDGKDVIYASLDAPLVPALRSAIVGALDSAGVPVKADHGFTPHITLVYVDPKTNDMPRVDTRPAVFEAVSVVVGEKRIDVPLTGSRFQKQMPGEAPEKLTNERANLRTALKANRGERCGFCQYFKKPDVCGIVVGPVTADQVCDWIQSRGVKGAPSYKVEDDDWLDFVAGMAQEQPYQHKVIDGAVTPEGPVILIEDTADPPHRFSLSKDFHIGHTTLEHHWTQAEVDRLITAGRNIAGSQRPKAMEKALAGVPTVGPKGALIAVVGASPSAVDKARREPFTGPNGSTLNEQYLKQLGVKRADVVLANAVPIMLADDAGAPRDPSADEIDQWRSHLADELDRLSPRIVVTVGKAAKEALGDRADFALPHPQAIKRGGDRRGELKRKLPQIRKALVRAQRDRRLEDQYASDPSMPFAKQAPKDEGGETRGARAFRTWENTWHEQLPKSGKGKFIYQHHWRGLSPDRDGLDERKLSESKLLDTNRSLHGDIRLEGDGQLWGFAVLIGEAKDNRRAGGDKLIAMKAGQTGDPGNIQLANKLPQPKEWLDVGKAKPLISDPPDPGTTARKSAKFFALTHGTYELGVVRRHSVEIFLDSPKLKGRYLLTFAPVAGRRRWLIRKPRDQTPLAERSDLADLVSEVRKKRQRFLIWSKPGQTPRKIDVRKFRPESEKRYAPILKSLHRTPKRIVYAPIYEPYGATGLAPDGHNDLHPPADIEEAAHAFQKGPRVIGFQHGREAEGDVVESWLVHYPSHQDYENAVAGRAHRAYRMRFGDDVVTSGTWMMGIGLGRDEWRDVQDGKLGALSPSGISEVRPLRRADLPVVTFVDLVEAPDGALARQMRGRG